MRNIRPAGRGVNPRRKGARAEAEWPGTAVAEFFRFHLANARDDWTEARKAQRTLRVLGWDALWVARVILDSATYGDPVALFHRLAWCHHLGDLAGAIKAQRAMRTAGYSCRRTKPARARA